MVSVYIAYNYVDVDKQYADTYLGLFSLHVISLYHCSKASIKWEALKTCISVKYPKYTNLSEITWFTQYTVVENRMCRPQIFM